MSRRCLGEVSAISLSLLDQEGGAQREPEGASGDEGNAEDLVHTLAA